MGQTLFFRSLAIGLFLVGVVAVRSYGVVGGEEALPAGEFYATRLWLQFKSDGTLLSEVRPAWRLLAEPVPADSEATPPMKKECKLLSPEHQKRRLPGAS